ncbi:MAG: type II toxin-antitoxin system Phd/YefM family antitoxin [bacterium]|nr:type II toxin-antitoxin system Phd/YefM family antitoxin [bacterium]
MISVPASEVQKNFSEYEEKAVHEPVEVTHAGRSSYLVSERLFRDMMSSYRRAIPIEALSDGDIALIEQAEVKTDAPYDLADIPDIVDAPSPVR